MFNSQYYTCEQVDERLLQGYVDDFNEVNSTNYSKDDLLLKLFQAINWDKVFGKYEENPEFVRLYTDINNKLLWGIKVNGDIYYGAGVPSQIKNYIDSKISELHLDKVEDILIFLDDLIDSDKTLKELLSEKVDKEEGKSLIDAEYASSQSAIDNPEYLKVIMDNEHKMIEAFRKDGRKIIYVPIEIHDGALIYTERNPEFIKAEIDGNGKLLNGIRADGDGIYAGINVSEMKRDLDVGAIGFRYEAETGNFYVKTNNDSTITIRYDEATGNLYQIKDVKVKADIEIREGGDMYICQNL